MISRRDLILGGGVAAGVGLALRSSGIFSERENPLSERFALLDQARIPEPLQTYPLRGFRISHEIATRFLDRVSLSVSLKSFTAGRIHALRLLRIARATPGLASLPNYEIWFLRMIDSPLDAKSGTALPILIDTPYGAGYRTRIRDEGVNSPVDPNVLGGMTHVDKVLSVFGELGISLRQPVVTSSGTHYPLASILEDSLQRYHPDRELDWSFIAYCDYLNQTSWTNRRGEEFRLDDLLIRLLDRGLERGPCLGCHRLYGVSKALIRSRVSPGLFRASTIRRAESHLRQVGAALATSQAADGSWDRAWTGHLSAPAAHISQDHDAEMMESLTATGHVLEWCAIMPPEFRPSDEVIRRAIDYMIDRMDTESSAGYCFGRGLLPTTHACRAIIQLGNHQGDNGGIS